MANVYASDEALLRDYHKLSQEYQNKAGRYIKNLLKLHRAEMGLAAKVSVFEEPEGENASYPAARPRCSFCGKKMDNVELLIAGPGACICNECVDLCVEILNEKKAENGESESAEEKEKTD